MKTIIKYISDNGKEFKSEDECINYERHINKITNRLDKIKANQSTDLILEEVMNVFYSDEQFSWVGDRGNETGLGKFGRAISDCTDGYDKPYLIFYNLIF